MNLTYVGPFDAVEVAGQIVKHGETISFSSDIAGRAPDPRIDAAHLELADAVASLDHDRAIALRDEIIGLDHGTGLLGQPSNWLPAKAKKTKATSDTEATGEVEQ
jgi:hypothetical protein